MNILYRVELLNIYTYYLCDWLFFVF